MPNPTAAMLVIGDEILSGRTRDANMYYLAGELTKLGVDLQEVRVVSDESDAIINAVNDLRGAFDHVFTSGGIGPTHDDITATCVAAAFGAEIGARDDARAILQAHYDAQGVEFTDARMRMARIPDGATLIDNPISAAPGFQMENVYVMAGVPAIFQAMAAAVLSTLTGGDPLISETVRIDKPESEIAGPLGVLAKAHPDLSMGSYPFSQNGSFGANVVIRGTDGEAVALAAAELRTFLNVADT